MKRLLCFILLCITLSFSVFSAVANVTVDGNIHQRKEYADNSVLLFSQSNISNNNVTNATVFWVIDETNYSLYIAVKYFCTDYEENGGNTAVELLINNRKCGKFYPFKNQNDPIDQTFFDVNSAFEIHNDSEADVSCEIRIGIKEGFKEDITAEFIIYDFSGSPSNHYRQKLFTVATTPEPSPEATTKNTTTKKETTTKESTTKETTVTNQTTRTIKETVPETRASVTAPHRPPETLPMYKTTTLPPTTKKEKTTKVKSTQITSKIVTTETPTESTSTIIMVQDVITTTEESTTEEDLSLSYFVERSSAISRFRTTGIAIAASLVTAAFMIAVFFGMHRHDDKSTTDNDEGAEN